MVAAAKARSVKALACIREIFFLVPRSEAAFRDLSHGKDSILKHLRFHVSSYSNVSVRSILSVRINSSSSVSVSFVRKALRIPSIIKKRLRSHDVIALLSRVVFEDVGCHLHSITDTRHLPVSLRHNVVDVSVRIRYIQFVHGFSEVQIIGHAKRSYDEGNFSASLPSENHPSLCN